MKNGNPFGIEDEGKTAGMLSYFFVLGWSMAFFVFHKYERNRLSSFHMRQTLLLYLVYVAIHYGVPILFGIIGLPVALFSTLYFIIPLNLLFVGLWSVGLTGAAKGAETPIPVFGEPAQRVFANVF